jgi:hypothetical protein
MTVHLSIHAEIHIVKNTPRFPYPETQAEHDPSSAYRVVEWWGHLAHEILFHLSPFTAFPNVELYRLL